jgi:ABC-type transport system substrate-binding protein
MMKRLLLLLVLLTLALGVALPIGAQDAPSGTWLGTWPYAAPGTHNLNGFAAGGLNDNLGVVYRPFVHLTPAFYLWASNTYEGLLAESWGFTDDNAAYEYTIKEGATWSDGSPVTAQDVVDTFSIGRIQNWTQWTYLTSVEAVDERTVRFTFTEGGASLNAERQLLKEYVVDSGTYGDLAAQAREVADSGATREDEAWTTLAPPSKNSVPKPLSPAVPTPIRLRMSARRS